MAERLSHAFITAGGVGTILAVGLIFVFLVSVVWPLFEGADVEALPHAPVAGGLDQPARLVVDEYQVLGLGLLPEGRLKTFDLASGAVLDDREVVPGSRLTAWSFGAHGDDVAFGFADGTVRTGSVGFSARFAAPSEVPPELRSLPVGGRAPLGRGMAERVSGDQFRVQEPTFTLGDPIPLPDRSPVLRIDHAVTGTGRVFVALTEGGHLSLYTATEKHNMLTGAVTTTVREDALPLSLPADGRLPSHVMLSGVGDTVYAVWDDGRTVRVDARDREHPVVAETLDLVEAPGVRLTSLAWLLGKGTLVAGDGAGRLVAWFPVRQPGAATSDGARLLPVHVLAEGGAAVTAIFPSARRRLVAAGFADGRVRVVYVTSDCRVLEEGVDAGPVVAVALAPKDDGLVALSPGRVSRWRMDVGHPEATPGALFGKVWYEGYESPEHAWQSSSGTDDFEPKLGLVPLVVGTLKATFYSMLFGVPLALLAALYTSEFLHPRVKTTVKSTIEIMASLPSVVLGFLAALVIAPFVQGVVPAVLTSFATVPLCLLLGAYLWQLLPQAFLLRIGGGARFLAILLVGLPLGLWTAALLGPEVEQGWFAGDLGEWLDGRRGSGVGGWMLLLLPLSAVVTMILMGRVVTPWIRSVSVGWSRGAAAAADLGRFLAGVLLTFLLVWGLSSLLSHAGFDPRGTVIGTYVQRNALVVGFVMGFAIIPIIYTLAEDALTSVPRHLREASLGAGATPWQTALRIIVPTAMSGLFSAVMIGLGRAVGETMIVLMAAGNTPVMDLNIFNGFRTLSANIATEMPEAVRDSTHYRTLFLAALTLFAMTFVVNTLAERVRQRFRKRAFQL